MCSNLSFGSRAKGDAEVLEITWDGRLLKQMLASTDSETDLRTIVKNAITLKRCDSEEYPATSLKLNWVRLAALQTTDF